MDFMWPVNLFSISEKLCRANLKHKIGYNTRLGCWKPTSISLELEVELGLCFVPGWRPRKYCFQTKLKVRTAHKWTWFNEMVNLTQGQIICANLLKCK